MNFLILKDFSRNFFIFYEFVVIYFEFKRIKKVRFLSRADVAADAAREKVIGKWLRMNTPRGARIFARVCASVCV